MPRLTSVPTDEQMKIFLDFKHALLSPPILWLPQYGTPYTIDVDASKGQLGCALFQRQEDVKFLPVGCWSRTHNQAERNYSATERECLGALVYSSSSISLVKNEVHGKNRSPCSEVGIILSNVEGRLAKWRLQLAEFDFEVVYRPGVKHQFLMHFLV